MNPLPRFTRCPQVEIASVAANVSEWTSYDSLIKNQMPAWYMCTMSEKLAAPLVT